MERPLRAEGSCLNPIWLTSLDIRVAGAPYVEKERKAKAAGPEDVRGGIEMAAKEGVESIAEIADGEYHVGDMWLGQRSTITRMAHICDRALRMPGNGAELTGAPYQTVGIPGETEVDGDVIHSVHAVLRLGMCSSPIVKRGCVSRWAAQGV
jgi:hypothetical protein